MTQRNLLEIVTAIAFLACSQAPSWAQHCTDSAVPGTLIGFTPLPGQIERPDSCNLLPCYEPELKGGPTVETDENCDALSGACPVRARVTLDFPGNSQMPTNTHVRVYWFGQATPAEDACLPPPLGNCSPISICGPLGAEILVDKGETWIQQGVSCADIASGAYQQRSFSISAYACQTFSGECTERLDVPGIALPPPGALWDLLGCDPPPPPCNRCPCNMGGDGCGGSPFGGSPFCLFDGPGAVLRYQARGAGHPDFPGTAEWNTTLGRYWSHDYAERIVMDPDESHVWLITREAGFHEFSGLVGGVYQDVSPSDEYRRLSRTAGGWELRDLDGTVRSFDASGLWTSTVNRNGNATVGMYVDGQLSSVSFPDARSETFSYHPDGKLAAITEVGVDGVTSRTWSYTWSGPDLVRIDRPDGTARTFRYDDARHPGYMTRVTLVGTEGGERVENAREYDERGNVVRTWKGDVSFTGPDAVGTYSFGYDNPFRPQVTEVTDPLGNVTTYEVGRDPGGVKPRVAQVSGDCSTCGVGPNTQRFYEDSANPMRVTRSIDARGTVTLFEYDGNGQMTSRTEAFMTDLERTTTWEYDNTFPSLVTAIEQPSTSGAGVRRTSWVYDGAGNATSQTVEGVENGSPFRYETATVHNSVGQVESIDPPGYGAQDRTVFGYDPGRGNLIVVSRTDPLIGTTSFGYDAFNRRTSVTDVNGVVTQTVYDPLDRVISVIQKGATAAEDLVATQVYNEFGEFFRTILPKGNILEYGYDSAGRLISIERKPEAVTPAERTFYTLDATGNRVREDLQRWNGAGWVTESFTGFEYSTRCHLDKVLHADGTVTEYAYDCEGNLERMWDANHPSEVQSRPPTRLYAYDELNRLLTVTQPWTGVGGGDAVTAYGYDMQDHLVQVTDANGTVTSYFYSDRDLLTEEVSEVSGRTSFRYNDHGKLIAETDARGVTVLRQVDALDRVRFIDYPEDTLDITYRYDEAVVPFSKGRLTAIDRAGAPVAYRYDRFGRLTQDGVLTFGYDRNGNRVTVGYPGGMTARYSFDFADRQATLALEGTGAASGPVVTSAEYLPSGPLARLELGNGLTEVRGFDARYFPTRITVGELFDWVYTTDSVGNVTTITDGLDPAGSRSYGYQDMHYFLTSGDGPWGDLSWTYDKIGNRRGETRDGATAAYSYFPNAAGGNSPKLAVVAEAGGETSRYFYDAIGDLTAVAGEATKTRYSYDAARRLSRIARDAAGEPPAVTDILYDGRGFLRSATLRWFATNETRESGVETTATYSSDGLLQHRGNVELPDPTAPRETAVTTDDVAVLYFAGRPVAQVALGAAETGAVTYLTTDHLGTPALATNSAAAEVWSDGFEPFGADWSGAGEAGVLLRFPGQWLGGGWGVVDENLYYNSYRWYRSATGRFTRTDPINLGILENVNRSDDLPIDAVDAYYLSMLRTGNPRFEHTYGYVAQNPLLFADPLGLFGPGALATAGGACVAVDGPVPAGDVIGVPLLIAAGVWAAAIAIVDWWDNADECDICKPKPPDPCAIGLVQCLESPWQPEWNKPTFGPRKDCGACYRECKNNGGVWPYYKCPA